MSDSTAKSTSSRTRILAGVAGLGLVAALGAGAVVATSGDDGGNRRTRWEAPVAAEAVSTTPVDQAQTPAPSPTPPAPAAPAASATPPSGSGSPSSGPAPSTEPPGTPDPGSPAPDPGATLTPGGHTVEPVCCEAPDAEEPPAPMPRITLPPEVLRQLLTVHPVPVPLSPPITLPRP